MESITITLNGVEVSGYEGATILDLAGESGVYIPTLCHDQNLAPTGACRLCLVEEEKSGALLASCVAPITPGMTINTRSPRVLEHRKRILELLLASHPDLCLVCDKGNRCQLRTLAAEMGIGRLPFQRIPQFDVIEEVNPFIERDLSKCVMCGKCVRVDQELVVEGAIDYMNRGTMVRAATLNDMPLELSECTFCGACVAVCPTGALMEKDRAYTGTANTTVTTVCPYCGCGCTLVLGVKDGRVVNAAPAPESPVNAGTLCVRGSYGWDFIYSPERLHHPLIRENGAFREATWEEALSRATGELKRIKDTHGPEALAVFGSSRCTNEENYLLQRFARGVLGTNNIDNGSCLYGAASLAGLGASIGYAGTTGSLGSLERSQVIMVIGADPEISAPAVAYAVKRAAKYKGSGLIVIDPRRTALAPFARLWLRPRPGTDIALLNGLARVIIRESVLDDEFVSRTTDNFTDWSMSLERYTPAFVEEVTGIHKKDLQAAARILAGAEGASIVYGNGITQHANGAGAVAAIANLAMLTGNTGRRGGIFALQRENNAHGACDMGALPGFLPGYRSIDNAANRQEFEERWGVRLSTGSGLTAPEMVAQARAGIIKGMFVMGENPVVSLPQPSRVKEALDSLECLVVADMFLTETAARASVVLPAASFAEKDGTFTNFEGRVQRVNKAIQPAGDSLPDFEILLRLAKTAGAPMPYDSQRQVAEEIEEMVLFYRHAGAAGDDVSGLDWNEIDGNSPGARRLHNGLFPSGFGRFSPVAYTPPQDAGTDAYPYTLMVGSDRYRFGAGSRSARSARLSRFRPEAFLEISRSDAAGAGINNDDIVTVRSEHGELAAPARLSDALPPGVLFMPLSFPDLPVYELFSTGDRASLKTCAVRLERTGDNG